MNKTTMKSLTGIGLLMGVAFFSASSSFAFDEKCAVVQGANDDNQTTVCASESGNLLLGPAMMSGHGKIPFAPNQDNASFLCRTFGFGKAISFEKVKGASERITDIDSTSNRFGDLNVVTITFIAQGAGEGHLKYMTSIRCE